jgi:hypothetical protein
MNMLKKMRIACLPLVLLASHADATIMYRFTNDAGDPVYSYTLPPGQADAGYQKVEVETGTVVETVDPQLPPAQLAEKLRRDKALKDCREELERIYQLYGSEGDITYAKRQAVAAIDTRVGQLQANLRQARREQDRLRSRAADAERAGREIPQALLGNMQRSLAQIETLEVEIESRQEEQGQAQARYARELDRFLDGTCPEPGTLADAGSP